MKISVIIPVLNEEQSIGAVLNDIPKDLVADVIVVDNGSTDHTPEIAHRHGARVVSEPRRGYGYACLRGIQELNRPDVVVFLDGDFSDYPEEMSALVEPILRDQADLVIGSRSLGKHDKDALPPHAAFGNRIAGVLINLLFGFRYSDLGPFRAIRYDALEKLRMVDQTWGWTVEMQIKAIKNGLRILEVPVSYRRRIGKSKITGTLVGSIKAGSKIIWTILKHVAPASRRLLPALIFLFTVTASAQYVVNVQVVDLQISVLDKKGQFLTDLQPEDFLVFENNRPQEVLDLELKREPFSIGVLIDTSSSMQPVFQLTQRSTQDFLSSLRSEDEYFVMTFDSKIQMVKEITKRSDGPPGDWKDLRYGNSTKLYEGLIAALERLGRSDNTRRALFLISDGVNTSGSGSLREAIKLAQEEKVLVYSLVFENYDADMNSLRTLSESTGGTYFILYGDFPRLQAAYDKIASDLAHRFTLFYRSSSDYSDDVKPEIIVRMKDPALSVRFQRTYYPR